jgi:hypothetical protein
LPGFWQKYCCFWQNSGSFWQNSGSFWQNSTPRKRQAKFAWPKTETCKSQAKVRKEANFSQAAGNGGHARAPLGGVVYGSPAHRPAHGDESLASILAGFRTPVTQRGLTVENNTRAGGKYAKLMMTRHTPGGTTVHDGPHTHSLPLSPSHPHSHTHTHSLSHTHPHTLSLTQLRAVLGVSAGGRARGAVMAPPSRSWTCRAPHRCVRSVLWRHCTPARPSASSTRGCECTMRSWREPRRCIRGRCRAHRRPCRAVPLRGCELHGSGARRAAPDCSRQRYVRCDAAACSFRGTWCVPRAFSCTPSP